MNLRGLTTELTAINFTVVALTNNKIRFTGDGFVGECEIHGGRDGFMKVVRTYINKEYDHDQVVKAQKLIAEWQRGVK